MPYADKEKDKEYKREYYKKYNAEHKEQLKKTQKKYRENNPDKVKKATNNWRKNNPDVVKAMKTAWRLLNKDKINKQKKAIYDKDKDKILAKQRELAWYKTDKAKNTTKIWRKNNIARILFNNKQRLQRVKEAGGTFTFDEWEEMKKKYGYQCLKCKSTTKKLTVDHIIPIIHGGRNEAENIQPLCQSCNSSKGTKIEDYR